MYMPEIRFPGFGINIGHLSRIAIPDVFGINIMWYGITMGLGVFLGLFVCLHEAKRTKQNRDLYFDFFFFAVIAGVIGARLYYVIFKWSDYKNNLLDIFAIREGGLAIYGTVIACVITAVIFTRVKKYNFWKFADTAVLGLIVGQIIGRFGNFFNREAFGDFTNNIFRMQYQINPTDTINNNGDITEKMLNNIQTFNGAQYIQVHPTFLYEALWNLCLFIGLNLYKKHKAFQGEIFALYVLGYGIGRFWIEGLRTDQLKLFGTNLAVSQLLSVVAAVCALAFIIFMRIREKNKKSAEPVLADGVTVGSVDVPKDNVGNVALDVPKDKEETAQTKENEKVSDTEKHDES